MEHKLEVSVMQATIDHYRTKYPDSSGAQLSDERLLEVIRDFLADEVTGAVVDALLYYEDNYGEEE